MEIVISETLVLNLSSEKTTVIEKKKTPPQ